VPDTDKFSVAAVCVVTGVSRAGRSSWIEGESAYAKLSLASGALDAQRQSMVVLLCKGGSSFEPLSCDCVIYKPIGTA
jgi:hypothetical protein